MLGSFFDLKREVARIAAQRAAAEAHVPAEDPAPIYSDFDGRLQDFVRSFNGHDAAESRAVPRPALQQQRSST